MIIIMIKVEGRGRRGGQMDDNNYDKGGGEEAGEEDRWMIIIMIKVEERGWRGGQMDDNNYDKGGGEGQERRTDG